MQGLLDRGLLESHHKSGLQFTHHSVRDAPLLMALCITDASLTVCATQGNRKARVLAGAASSFAAYGALAAFTQHTRAAGVNAGVLANELRLLFHPELKHQCTARVYWNCLAHEAARLPLPTEKHMGKGLIPVTFRHGSSAHPGEHRLVSTIDFVDRTVAQGEVDLLRSGCRVHTLQSNSTNAYSALQEPVVGVCA